MISYQNEEKRRPKGLQAVSEYAVLRIDIRSDNARYSACSVVMAEARAGHNVADGPVLWAQAVGRAAVVSRSG